MASNEDLFKREEDRKWRERTDERIASLTASETVQNDRLDELHESNMEIIQILRGRTGDKDDGGIEGDLRDVVRSFNELRALFFPDHLGNGGIIARLKALEKKEVREEQSAEYRWKFWTAVMVAFLSCAGLLVREWPDLIDHWNASRSVVQKPVGKKKPHRRHAVVREEPNASDDAVPEVQ